MQWLNQWIDWLTATFGVLGVMGVIFAETGLFFGFFLPGDSFLFAAGAIASTGQLNPWYLIPGVMFASIAGDNTGYWMGKKWGVKMFTPQSKILRLDYLEKAKDFFAKYGLSAILLAKFIPAVRTFTPIVMGASGVDRKKFFLYSVMSGVVWAGGLTTLGLIIGKLLDFKKYELWFIGGIIILSLLPVAREWWKMRQAKSNE
jgi:membrane-associated protein